MRRKPPFHRRFTGQAIQDRLAAAPDHSRAGHSAISVHGQGHNDRAFQACVKYAHWKFRRRLFDPFRFGENEWQH